ncbi:hypothetical protein CUZ56_02099 [Saezia sanguinis]|uniref:Uncharacterized protein n=1 Tax=Saezia sanguinis TaxID=1965230 RepID=A0A433SCA5_9BURK|nr:hypothetical protein [Saezia sanguinis]RUS66373.1 hypothetical protein CUZ56_02099 [Saezia sanguinis]
MNSNAFQPSAKTQGGFGNALAWVVIRGVQLTIFFAYVTCPLWLAWLANATGYREVSSHDMLVAMAWLPLSCGITALSFMKHGGKHLKRGWLSFIILNAIAVGALVWVMF